MSRDPDTSTKTKDEMLSAVLEEMNDRISHVNRRCFRLEQTNERLEKKVEELSARLDGSST